MKLLLTSAGIMNNAIAQTLVGLAGKSLSELDLLFVPSAANTEGGDKRWLIRNLVDFEKAGFRSIDILEIAGTTEREWQPRFDAADVICFGGGNELHLAKLLDTTGIGKYLASFPEDKIYMGISAGSMVAGRFMPNELYSLVYPEENFGKMTAPALVLCDLCFIPHLGSDFFTHARKENLENLKDRFPCSVYATDDETALRIRDGKIDIIGSGNSWIFEK
jgi:dipeptidase E